MIETIYFPIQISCTGTTGWSILHGSGLEHPPKEGAYLKVMNGKLSSYGDPDPHTADEQTLELFIPPEEEPDTEFYHLGRHANDGELVFRERTEEEETTWRDLKAANDRIAAVRDGAARGW